MMPSAFGLVHGRLLRGPATVLAIAIASCTLCSGCFLWTSAGKGDDLQKKIDEQEARIAALEDGMQQERQQLRDEVERAEQKVDELEQVLEEATEVVRRNSADLGLEVEKLRDKLAEMQGKIAEATHQTEQVRQALQEQRQGLEEKLEQFARRAGVDMALDPESIPDDKEAHWEAAVGALDDGEHSKARALLREYLRRYGGDDRADDAQYRLGTSYLAQDRPATALGELRKVISEHGDSDSVDDALLAMANAFYELGSCSDAEAALQALIRSHSRSRLVPKARKRLARVRRAEGSDRCTN